MCLVLGRMKYLIPVLAGGATITAAITTAVASAHSAFSGHVLLRPYLVGYAVAAFLLIAAGVIAFDSHRRESRLVLAAETTRTQGEQTLRFVLDVVGNQPLSSQLFRLAIPAPKLWITDSTLCATWSNQIRDRSLRTLFQGTPFVACWGETRLLPVRKSVMLRGSIGPKSRNRKVRWLARTPTRYRTGSD